MNGDELTHSCSFPFIECPSIISKTSVAFISSANAFALIPFWKDETDLSREDYSSLLTLPGHSLEDLLQPKVRSVSKDLPSA